MELSVQAVAVAGVDGKIGTRFQLKLIKYFKVNQKKTKENLNLCQVLNVKY